MGNMKVVVAFTFSHQINNFLLGLLFQLGSKVREARTTFNVKILTTDSLEESSGVATVACGQTEQFFWI